MSYFSRDKNRVLKLQSRNEIERTEAPANSLIASNGWPAGCDGEILRERVFVDRKSFSDKSSAPTPFPPIRNQSENLL